VKRGRQLKRTPLGPGKKALERGRQFAADPKPLRQVSEKRQQKNVAAGKPANAPSLKDGNGLGASSAQRAKVDELPCIVTGAEKIEGAAVDAAHLWPRSMGGCSLALCVVPLRRDIHELFEDGQFDLYPYLTPARHSDAWKPELFHALEHADMSMTRLLHELTGERHLPESEILRLAEAAA
jgi:hypothetical protein